MLTRHTQRNLTWIDLSSPTPGEVRSLMTEFEIDPLIAQELLARSFRSKVERRGDVLYIILHFPTARGHTASDHEIDFVVGKNFLITTRYEGVDPLHSFATAFEAKHVLGRATATHGGHLFIEMMASLYQSLIDHSEYIGRKLSDIEDKIFKGNERQMVAEISHIGRAIHDFRRALLPHREMLISLEPVAGRFFGTEFGYHVQSVLGTYMRVERDIDAVRESLVELRETNNSLLSTKQNEIVKNLTVVAFVFLPLSFIASLFQMNTENPIVGIPHDFWIVLGGMGAVAVSCFLYFKYKKWL